MLLWHYAVVTHHQHASTDKHKVNNTGDKLMNAIKENRAPKIIRTDARHKISLGSDAAEYYEIRKTSDGYRLTEIVDFVTKRDQDLQSDTAFWNENLETLNKGEFVQL